MSFIKLLVHITSQKFKYFCQHCTLHGVYYFYSSGRWWVHAVWVFIITASLFLCCYLSHMIWDKFVVDPTLTVVETTHYSTADIPFPAVAVCDAEIYGPNTDNITQLLSLRGYNRTQISEFVASFAEIKLKDYSPKNYVKKMHFLLEDLGFPLSSLVEMFKKPCESILVECTWRSQPYNCSDMFRPVFTMMGPCCQFDVSYFRKNVNNEQTNFISGVQPTEALDILVDGLKISADGVTSNGYLSLYVFDEEDEITLVNNALVLTPAAYFDINVYMWAIDSSTYVKALDLEKRRCILETDPGATSFQGCMTRLILREVVELCRCLPFNFTAEELAVEDYEHCTWDRLICIYHNLEKIQADICLVTSQSECFQKCDYVQYETEVEFIKNQRNLNSNATRVSVHFSETTCMKYRREVLYTWDQMLANLGGIFGLCLGGSIISVIEIIWFILDLVFTIINEILTQKKVNNRNKTKVLDKQYANKIFVLNQVDVKSTHTKKPVVRYKFAN